VYKQAEKYALPLCWLAAGDSIDVDGTSRFAVLGPLTRDTLNENNNSLVMRLITPQGDLMLTGDMEVPAEQALLAAGLVQGAAVLKVGHHGDGDASSETFLYTVRPQIAVISTSTAQEPDTPDAGVMRRLWTVGTEVFVTQRATCGVLVTLSGGSAVGRLVDYPIP
jgi:beta-lactamase superfamily II metal-dependent hydrolase